MANRDWRASLFDRLAPNDSLGISDDDKSRLSRQSLLHAALAMAQPNGGNTFAAIANGLQTGLLAANQGAEDITNRRYKQQVMANQLAGPAGMREFQMMAKAAGLQEGTPEYQQAANIALGREGRASNAGLQQDSIDINGVPTLVTFNPRTGRNEVATLPSMPGSDPVAAPLGGQGEAQPSFGILNPEQDFAALSGQFGISPSSTLRSPQRNAKVGGVPNSFHLTGEAADYPVPAAQKPQFIAQARQMGYQAIDEGDHVHLEPPRRGMAITGRRKEDEAAAIEAAKYGAQINAQPTLNTLEAQRAAMVTAAEEAQKLAAYDRGTSSVVNRESAVAGAKAGAQADAERAAKLNQKAIDAGGVLDLLDQAEPLVGRSTGSAAGAAADAALSVAGRSTTGANAIAQLKAISGQLVSKMPRMEGPQSNMDVQLYKEMAGDLANPMVPRARRLAALHTIRSLQQKYATPAKPEKTGVDSRRQALLDKY